MKLFNALTFVLYAAMRLPVSDSADPMEGFSLQQASLTGASKMLRGSSSFDKTLADAVCYAERYPDLLQGYCQGEASLCLYGPLFRHYEEHGKAANLLWGCRKRVIEPAVPLAADPSEDTYTHGNVNAMGVHFLIFETEVDDKGEKTLIEQSLTAGIHTTRIGLGETFEGFSSKWHATLSFLKNLPPTASDTLVVVTDARDVLLNIHDDYITQDGITQFLVDHFVSAYNSLTTSAPGAVVMSAEAQCCVAALTYAEPGSYFDSDGRRSQRACSSGNDGCTWGGDSKLVAWEDIQINIARNRTGRSVQDVYLNAGLVAGLPVDLIRLLEAVDLEASEDDQAVFTEYMYLRPDKIVLDYASEMFGTARWPLGMGEKGCPFGQVVSKKNQDGRFPALRHLESKTMPLLLHTPGKFSECYEYIYEELGLVEDAMENGDGDSLEEMQEEERVLKEAKQQQQTKQVKQQQNTQQNKNKQGKQQNNNNDKKKTTKHTNNGKTKQPKNYVVQVRSLF